MQAGITLSKIRDLDERQSVFDILFLGARIGKMRALFYACTCVTCGDVSLRTGFGINMRKLAQAAGNGKGSVAKTGRKAATPQVSDQAWSHD